jgi:hypothetical protein
MNFAGRVLQHFPPDDISDALSAVLLCTSESDNIILRNSAVRLLSQIGSGRSGGQNPPSALLPHGDQLPARPRITWLKRLVTRPRIHKTNSTRIRTHPADDRAVNSQSSGSA